MLYVYYSGLLLQRIIKQKKLSDIWRQLKYKFPPVKADTLNEMIGKIGAGVQPKERVECIIESVTRGTKTTDIKPSLTLIYVFCQIENTHAYFSF